MSRSAPDLNRTPNPASKFFEWSGADGVVRFYDKAAKKNVTIGSKFSFVFLDELATIRGWSDAHESSLYSNEVRDTKQEVFLVRAHKGGNIAEGFYGTIKDRVHASGGKFTASIYIAFKDGTELKLGNMQFSGAALNAWIEFRKAHRNEVEKDAVAITGFVEGKKGAIVFRVPKFTIVPLTPENNEAALEIDRKILQPHLKGYLSRTKTAQVETPEPANPSPDEEPALPEPDIDNEPADTSLAGDDIPF